MRNAQRKEEGSRTNRKPERTAVLTIASCKVAFKNSGIRNEN